MLRAAGSGTNQSAWALEVGRMPCASGADEGESAFQRREEHLNTEYSSQRFERQSATFLAEIRAGERALEPARSGFKCQFCYLLAGSLTHPNIGFLTGNMSPEWTNACQARSVWLLVAAAEVSALTLSSHERRPSPPFQTGSNSSASASLPTAQLPTALPFLTLPAKEGPAGILLCPFSVLPNK